MKSSLIFSILIILLTFQHKIKSQNYWEEIFSTGPSIFSMDASDDGVVYLGTAHGIWKSFDDGANWEFDTISPGNLVVYSLHTKNGGIVYAGCNGYVYYSDNYGVNWSLIFDEAIGNVFSIYIDSNNNLYVGIYSGIYRSADNGLNWELVLDLFNLETAHSIIEDSQNVLYAGTSIYMPPYEIGGLYYSIDSGISWSHIEATTNYRIQDISIDQDNNLICAVQYAPNSIGGVYKFNPTNGDWIVLKNNLIATAIVIDELNTYYVSSDNAAGPTGCMISYDNGQNWTSINSGLTNINIQTIDISSEGYLFSTSIFPSKLFRSVGSVYTGITRKLKEDNSSQIYPNPAENFLSIYTPSFHDLKVIELRNMKGVLVKLIKLVGNNVNINISDMKPGVYLYFIKHNGEIFQQGKLIKK